jgi:hypothetical protein
MRPKLHRADRSVVDAGGRRPWEIQFRLAAPGPQADQAHHHQEAESGRSGADDGRGEFGSTEPGCDSLGAGREPLALERRQ